MRRVKRDERGATAVVVALLIVALIAMAALAVDLGAAWADRKQVQNGADAAALAVAQQCAKGNCGDKVATASGFVRDNKNDLNATVKSVTTTATSATVVAQTTRQHWFAPVIGHDSSLIGASATASWGVIGAGATLPLAIASCAFDVSRIVGAGATPGPQNIQQFIIKASGNTTLDPCNPVGPVVPGGFHWLIADDTASCKVPLASGDWARSDTGADGPVKACITTIDTALRTGPVLVPMYGALQGTGSNARYQILGFAQFRATAYCMANNGDFEFPERTSGGAKDGACDRKMKFGSANIQYWIEGYFMKVVSLQDASLGSGNNYGAVVVTLTK